MEKLLRGTILSLAIILSLHAVCSRAGSTHLGPRSTNDDSMLELDVPQSREIGSIISMIKYQFREIIEDIITEAWSFIRSFITQMRDKLLNKLQKYTFSDVLRVVFNSLTDSLFDYEPELYVDAIVEPVETEPIEVELYTNPYSLTSLLKRP
ncbi:uncharacterized protein LOC142976247 [Anticarsia gemmatalis]|uniref:uncharacterized protein LOC142976247 n=1 Tax=Anticarsia gemmatalis TaxID=129554 RepID=UPI003F76C832